MEYGGREKALQEDRRAGQGRPIWVGLECAEEWDGAAGR